MLFIPAINLIPKAAGGATTPLTIFGSNCRLWFTAKTGVYSDAGSTPAVNTDPVQQWNDQSGNGYNLLQASSGARPVYNTTAINSLPALEMGVVSAVSRAMWTAANSVTLNSASFGTFVVFTKLADVTFGRICSFIKNGDAKDFTSTSSALFCLAGASGNTILGGGAADISISNSVAYRYAYTNDNGPAFCYIDNSISGTGTGAAGTLGPTGQVTLGSDTPSTVSTPLTCYVSEVVIVDVLPSAGQLTSMFNYQTSEWGF